MHPGVYATFTGPVSPNARLWAAVLHAGTGAQLSHETAAELLRLTDERCPLIHLTIPAERRIFPRDGTVIHRSSHMEQGWRFARGVPPHTLVEETILDLVDAAVNLDDTVGWITRAFQRNLTSEGNLRRAMDARKRLRWRALLDEVIPMAASGTDSTLEYRYDRDVEGAHGLPPARRQVPFTKPDGTKGFRDRFYDQYGLVVELDGRRYHDDRRDHDRRRDNAAAAAARATLRYGWEDVTRTQCQTAAQVYVALCKRGYAGTLKPCSPACAALAEAARATAALQRPMTALSGEGASRGGPRGRRRCRLGPGVPRGRLPRGGRRRGASRSPRPRRGRRRRARRSRRAACRR
jgi:hypothetical protein